MQEGSSLHLLNIPSSRGRLYPRLNIQISSCCNTFFIKHLSAWGQGLSADILLLFIPSAFVHILKGKKKIMQFCFSILMGKKGDHIHRTGHYWYQRNKYCWVAFCLVILSIRISSNFNNNPNFVSLLGLQVSSNQTIFYWTAAGLSSFWLPSAVQSDPQYSQTALTNRYTKCCHVCDEVICQLKLVDFV